MIDTVAFSQALSILFTSIDPWIYVIPGLVIGLVFGAIPGLQISMAMAVFLPVTWVMDFLQAMMFLTAIFTGGAYGGGVTAILMNIPGSSSSVASAFDGYPMARKGRHNEALGIGLGASVFGTFFGYMLLFLLIQPLASLVLKLGPLEMVMIVFWGLALIATLNDSTVLKGLLAGCFGLLLSQIGMSSTGSMRATLGSPYLIDGVSVVPAMIGLFAASELLRLRSSSYLVEDESSRRISLKKILSGFKEAFAHPKAMLKGSSIGALIGVVPGVGSSVANLVAYSEMRRTSKEPEKFGTGCPEGLIAAETSNSSSEGGSMTALLALGIPGGAATAVLLAAFSFHNLIGGPSFIRDQQDIVYSIIIGNFGQVILLAIVALMLLPILGLVVKIPLNYLVPSVLALCAWGAFGITGTIAGPVTVVVFSAIGWLMRRHQYPIPATVIGLLLGKMTEGELVRTLQISGGSPISYFTERPIALILLGMFLLFVIIMPIMRHQKQKKTALAHQV